MKMSYVVFWGIDWPEGPFYYDTSSLIRRTFCPRVVPMTNTPEGQTTAHNKNENYDLGKRI
jgi:hypothetical protein